MAATSIVAVGTGASGALIEQLARLGIKRWRLFDPDIVERKNLVAQNFAWDDLAAPKPDALVQRLRNCEFERGNPLVPPLDAECLGDVTECGEEGLAELVARERRDGAAPILLLASDSHPAQALGNRAALASGVPAFFAGMYREGKAGEIIFVAPGTDLACYRYIAASRYAFSAGARRALRGSAPHSLGLPLATAVVDAILGHLLIGAIHAGDPGNPHGALYRRLLAERRNFIQVQLDPGYRLNGDDIFAGIRGPDVIAFNTIFQPHASDPDCPDCGSHAGSRGATCRAI